MQNSKQPPIKTPPLSDDCKETIWEACRTDEGGVGAGGEVHNKAEKMHKCGDANAIVFMTYSLICKIAQ